MARRALTLEEWADLPEDVSGEWVDGALEGEEVPNGFHELAVAWLVDPAVRTFEILELDPKQRRYAQAALASDGKLKVPGIRGLTLDLDALWRYLGAEP